MKKIKPPIISVLIIFSLSLLLVSCDNKNRPKSEEVSSIGLEKELEVDEQRETNIRGAKLAREIIEENFEAVVLEDFQINTEINDSNMINNADFYLYLDNDNQDEIEEIIDEYGQVFHDQFGEIESYLGITLYWMTPDFDKENAIERDYY